MWVSLLPEFVVCDVWSGSAIWERNKSTIHYTVAEATLRIGPGYLLLLGTEIERCMYPGILGPILV